MAQKQHQDNRAKYVLQMGMFGITNVERPAGMTGTEYVAYETPNGEWLLVKRVFTSTSETMTYASDQNNTSVATVAAAWTARATLTYGSYSEVWDS